MTTSEVAHVRWADEEPERAIGKDSDETILEITQLKVCAELVY